MNTEPEPNPHIALNNAKEEARRCTGLAKLRRCTCLAKLRDPDCPQHGLPNSLKKAIKALDTEIQTAIERARQQPEYYEE